MGGGEPRAFLPTPGATVVFRGRKGRGGGGRAWLTLCPTGGRRAAALTHGGTWTKRPARPEERRRDRPRYAAPAAGPGGGRQVGRAPRGTAHPPAARSRPARPAWQPAGRAAEPAAAGSACAGGGRASARARAAKLSAGRGAVLVRSVPPFVRSLARLRGPRPPERVCVRPRPPCPLRDGHRRFSAASPVAGELDRAPRPPKGRGRAAPGSCRAGGVPAAGPSGGAAAPPPAAPPGSPGRPGPQVERRGVGGWAVRPRCRGRRGARGPGRGASWPSAPPELPRLRPRGRHVPGQEWETNGNVTRTVRAGGSSSAPVGEALSGGVKI